MSDLSEQPRRRRRQPAAPPPPQGSIARGAILIAVAIVVGFLLLRDDGASQVEVSVGTDTGTTDDGGGGDDVVDDGGSTTTTSSTLPARAPAQIKVIVANGSGVDGAAGPRPISSRPSDTSPRRRPTRSECRPRSCTTPPDTKPRRSSWPKRSGRHRPRSPCCPRWRRWMTCSCPTCSWCSVRISPRPAEADVRAEPPAGLSPRSRSSW